MGLDSVAVLTRWLLDPASRDFDLSRLTVLTAMTGDEYPSTADLMSRHVLPLLRSRRVRYVQISRTAQSSRAGYTVLNDSDEPTVMRMRGPWRLSDELRATATVPQVASGKRLCSARAKGEPLDAWIGEHIGRDHIHAIGFSAEEQHRIGRDRSYTRNARYPVYPLAAWGWDRARAGAFLSDVYRTPWLRSACSYCPFQRANPVELAQRWRSEPAAAAQALALEETATACNPRSALFGRTTARAFAATNQVPVPPDSAGLWTVLRVRRVFTARRGDPGRKGIAWRSLTRLAAGSREQMHALLDRYAAMAATVVTVDGTGIPRVWLRYAAPPYPSAEHLLALAAAGPRDKQRRGFESLWTAVTGDRPPDLDRP
jgi:hypothetical protein